MIIAFLLIDIQLLSLVDEPSNALVWSCAEAIQVIGIEKHFHCAFSASLFLIELFLFIFEVNKVTLLRKID